MGLVALMSFVPLSPHTALLRRLYGVNCTACVLPLRGCLRNDVYYDYFTVPYCLLPVALEGIRCAKRDGQRVEIPWVAEVRGAAVVTDEVVVVERVEVDAPVVVQFVAYS